MKRRCPSCRGSLHPDAALCPHCLRVFTVEDDARAFEQESKQVVVWIMCSTIAIFILILWLRAGGVMWIRGLLRL